MFTLNDDYASELTPGTYLNSINFNNTDSGQGNTTRVATLTVNPPVNTSALQVAPTSNIVVTGNQGAFAPSSFPYAISATAGSVNYSISGVPNWLTPASGTTATFTVKREQSRPRHLRPDNYHFHEHKQRPGHPDPDGNAHHQSASAAGNACDRHYLFGDTRWSILTVIFPL
jgi:hypothetical protein